MKNLIKTAIAGLFVSALAVSPALANGGSDSPTSYTVDAHGITLSPDRVFKEADHVNIKFSSGHADINVHIEGKCKTPVNGMSIPPECSSEKEAAANLIGKRHLEYKDFGLNPKELCISWVQIHGENAHFGEGGQKPVGKGCKTDPKPSETPSEIPTEEPTEVPSETPSEEPTEEPSEVPSEIPSEEPSSLPTPTESASVPFEEPTAISTVGPVEDVPTAKVTNTVTRPASPPSTSPVERAVRKGTTPGLPSTGV